VAGYVWGKVASWVSEFEKLAVTAVWVVFAAFTDLFLHRWYYVDRTTPASHTNLLMIIASCLLVNLPAGKPAFGPLERELLSLPARFGGLGIIIPSTYFPLPFPLPSTLQPLLLTSWWNSVCLVPLIFTNKRTSSSVRQGLHIVILCVLWWSPFLAAFHFLCDAIEAASKWGALGWLTTLPIADNGFAMQKGELGMLFVYT